jgi:hypothetical protein
MKRPKICFKKKRKKSEIVWMRTSARDTCVTGQMTDRTPVALYIYPDHGVQFRHGHLLGSFNSCGHLLLMLQRHTRCHNAAHKIDK